MSSRVRFIVRACVWLFLAETTVFCVHFERFPFMQLVLLLLAATEEKKYETWNGKKFQRNFFSLFQTVQIWHISIEMHWTPANEKKWIDEPPLFFACYGLFQNYCLNLFAAEEEKQGHRYLGHDSISCNCSFHCVCNFFQSLSLSLVISLSLSSSLSLCSFVHNLFVYRDRTKCNPFHLFLRALWMLLYRSTFSCLNAPFYANLIRCEHHFCYWYQPFNVHGISMGKISSTPI